MKQRKKILFLVPYPYDKAPSQRLKFEQYYDYLGQNGYEVTKSSFVSESFWQIIYKKGNWISKILYTLSGYLRRTIDLLRLRNYDIVYVHLWVTPLGLPVSEWLVCKLGKKVIYDIDDLVYLRESKSQVNQMVSLIKGRKKPIVMMKYADHVITCTPYLDEFVRQYNKHTTDISSTIDTIKYRPKNDYSLREGKLVLGWSGSHSTSKYLLLLRTVFLKLKEENVPFKLLVMGDENFSMDGIEVEALPWKESYEVEVISRFDIGLYPLPDEQWVYGKSGLKALQYMAAGIPTIATAIGANFRIIENGVNGFLASGDADWLKYIHALAEDEDLRQQIGRAGAVNVRDKFSIEANKDVYLSIIDSMTN